VINNFLKSVRRILLWFTAGNSETKMSSEGTYANANRCIVTVLPSTSPNRRILVFILVAVALVVLIALTATLIPIYMTGDGEDKDKG